MIKLNKKKKNTRVETFSIVRFPVTQRGEGEEGEEEEEEERSRDAGSVFEGERDWQLLGGFSTGLFLRVLWSSS